MSDNFIYVPKIKLYVSEDKYYYNNTFYECQNKLHSKKEKMLTPFEFANFLKYIKNYKPTLYREITEIRGPWRAEFLDANFKFDGKKSILEYHTFDRNGNLHRKEKKLSKVVSKKEYNQNFYTDDLIDILYNNNLPNSNIENWGLYYWKPLTNNDSIAWFFADDRRFSLSCRGSLSFHSKNLGVRLAKKFN